MSGLARKIGFERAMTNQPVDRRVSFRRGDGEIAGQRRISKPRRIEMADLENFDHRMKNVSFVDVIDVGQSAAQRNEAQKGRQDQDRQPEKKLVPFSQRSILKESGGSLEYV